MYSLKLEHVLCCYVIAYVTCLINVHLAHAETPIRIDSILRRYVALTICFYTMSYRHNSYGMYILSTYPLRDVYNV